MRRNLIAGLLPVAAALSAGHSLARASLPPARAGALVSHGGHAAHAEGSNPLVDAWQEGRELVKSVRRHAFH